MKGLYIFFKYEIKIINSIKNEVRDILASLQSCLDDDEINNIKFYDTYRKYRTIAESRMKLTIWGWLYWQSFLEFAHNEAIWSIVKKSEKEMERIINGNFERLPKY